MIRTFFKWPALAAGCGAALTVSLLAMLEQYGPELFSQEQIWLMAPFGATMVLLFALPDSPLAQPRNIIAGHIMTTAIGLAVMGLVGVSFWSLGLAVGLAISLMMLTGTVHPPAGANPLLVMLTGQPLSFVMTPVATGVLLIVLMGWVWHRLIMKRQYPVRWW